MPRHATDDGTLPAGQFGPDVYAHWRGSSLGEITDILEHRLILQLMNPLQGRTVLDVGCGDGTLLALTSRQGVLRVFGCDLDPRMVARARDRLLNDDRSAGLAVARCQELPFPDNSFDGLVCITVLAFLPDANRAVREMARVLRPGGTLVIGDLGRWSLWAARRRIRGWLGASLWRTARFRTAGELAAMMASAGLTVGSIKGAIFFPPWTPLARLMARIDPALGGMTTVGAAFVAVQAIKPDRSSSVPPD